MRPGARACRGGRASAGTARPRGRRTPRRRDHRGERAARLPRSRLGGARHGRCACRLAVVAARVSRPRCLPERTRPRGAACALDRGRRARGARVHRPGGRVRPARGDRRARRARAPDPARRDRHARLRGRSPGSRCRRARRGARTRDLAAPRAALFEMATYHGATKRPCSGALLGEPPGTTHPLDARQRRRRRAMLDTYRSQATVLAPFVAAAHELFRPAPRYDFSRAPHAGALFYERLGMPPRADEWRALVQRSGLEMAHERTSRWHAGCCPSGWRLMI